MKGIGIPTMIRKELLAKIRTDGFAYVELPAAPQGWASAFPVDGIKRLLAFADEHGLRLTRFKSPTQVRTIRLEPWDDVNRGSLAK